MVVLIPTKVKSNTLLLVLGLDSSQSISNDEFQLQLDGYSRALQDESILRLISSYDEIRLVMFEWSITVEPIINCEILSTQNISNIVNNINTHRRQLNSSTAISTALRYVTQLNCLPNAERKILDISGDGIENLSLPDMVRNRQLLLDNDWEINAIAMRTSSNNDQQFEELENWFRNNLQGGYRSFTLASENMQEFYQSIRRKLLIEIARN